MKTLKAIAVVAAAVVLTSSSLAWGPTGHMLVAQIAMTRLNPTAKAEVIRLLAIPPDPKGSKLNDNFVTAACWADDIKGVTHNFNEWHYKDIPFSGDGTPPEIDPPKNGDALIAINKCIATLKNASASDTEKATSLRFLIHLVGDVHQPLHCSTRCTSEFERGDRGGNDFPVQGAKNLHSYWDGGIGLFTSVKRPLDSPGQKKLSSLAGQCTSQYPASRNEWKDGNVEHWINESSSLAQSVAYNTEEGAKPTKAYVKKAQKTVRMRVAMGGYRLAALLNSIYPEH
jgi:hypothetical protein